MVNGRQPCSLLVQTIIPSQNWRHSRMCLKTKLWSTKVTCRLNVVSSCWLIARSSTARVKRTLSSGQWSSLKQTAIIRKPNYLVLRKAISRRLWSALMVVVVRCSPWIVALKLSKVIVTLRMIVQIKPTKRTSTILFSKNKQALSHRETSLRKSSITISLPVQKWVESFQVKLKKVLKVHKSFCGITNLKSLRLTGFTKVIAKELICEGATLELRF